MRRDERVDAFLTRLILAHWPYLWIDATSMKLRGNDRIISVAVTIAVGGNSDTRPELLSTDISFSEAEPL